MNAYYRNTVFVLLYILCTPLACVFLVPILAWQFAHEWTDVLDRWSYE